MAETGQPLVTLSVVSHGDAARIARLLESLRLHEKTDHLQLILTDNLGVDLPEFDPTSWAELKILRNKRPAGFAHNQNQALRSAQGKYFCVLNPDVVFEEAVLDPLLAGLEAGVADLIAPLVVNADGELQDSFRSLPTPIETIRRRLPSYRFESLPIQVDGVIRPDWMAGIFLLMPAHVFHQLGGFDERYRIYFEDVDFCTRARLAGMKLAVDPRLRIRHEAQRASRKRFFFLLIHLISAVRFFTSMTYRRAKGGITKL